MGALTGLRVVEMAGLGPAPFCAMLLADHGAEVVRIARPSQATTLGLPAQCDLMNRNRETLVLDLKTEPHRAALRQLLQGADALIEGFRPGVMEKLGFGPKEAAALNPRLVYGRMTGWGQTGPMAHSAGHDLNYAALSGAIAAMGTPGLPPPPPLNLVADMGGGAMMLAFGLLAALLEAKTLGQGQVVDAAMVDGSALLLMMLQGMRAGGDWSLERGANLLDGGTPYYACYETADGKYMAVCPLEPQFYALLLERLGLTSDPDFAARDDQTSWPRMRARLTEIFRAQPRAHWQALFADSDACVTPVLDMDEAPHDPHNQARGNFLAVEGIMQAAPAPRFSRTRAHQPRPPSLTPASLGAILARWG
jgi:alpha-methylacyl-CoA racemase